MIDCCNYTLFFLIYKDINLTNSLQSYFKKFIFVVFSATIIIHNLLQLALWRNVKNLSALIASVSTTL